MRVSTHGLNSSMESELKWLAEFVKDEPSAAHADFRRRLLSLLSFEFREFGSATALSVPEVANAGLKKLDEDPSRGIDSQGLSSRPTHPKWNCPARTGRSTRVYL
ncbi:hypothetical protein C8Q73DRAFT_663309 [Cubamyces lactineus]|nr:hypothetical protein C8Q73DRAFT_663309 [Cubamyces lactineus]